ncbi:MAG TPA: histidine kinase [Thermoleophilaceae bacterium]|nr:histidine kinase [Thermoleophilaceae bacterium]
MRGRRADLWVGVGGAAVGIGSAALEQAGVAGWLAGAVVGGSLAAVRSNPRAAWVTAALAMLGAAPFGPLPTGVFLLAAVHAFCAGRGDEGWWGIAALGALVGGLELDALLKQESGVPALLLPGAAWGAGRALRERELVAAQLAERARELEDEREAHAALSVRYERARIAAELHDIVAHAISVMVIQASAGQRLAAHDPEATADTFDAIAGAARQAEQDMGRLVSLLGDERAIGAAPDLALVEELVARASGSGLDVRLRLEGEREGWPAPLAEAAYRVVQEGLTNALRYAAGAPVWVLVRGGPRALAVEVGNAAAAGTADLSGLGTGTGLRGLHERVGACGGTLDAGPTPDGGWLLSARLPRNVTVPTS